MMASEKMLCGPILLLGVLSIAVAVPTQSMSSQDVSWRRNALRIRDLERDGWQMVFRGTSGNGHSVYDAWIEGANTNQDKPATMERTHGLHYRDPIVNNWSGLGVEFVKFAFYDENKEVAYVIFNGKGSNSNNWFDNSNVLDSSWSDLNSGEIFNYFSIVGHYIAERHDRRFFINRSYGGCPNDLGHMVVINSLTPAVCKWDNHATYPQFLYSRINSIDYWDRRMFGTADYMAIFIKTRL